MKTKLIADAGSTKLEWAFLAEDSTVLSSFTSDGINALLADDSSIAASFKEASSKLPEDIRVEEVHYYGAGCATPSICNKVEGILSQVWQGAQIYVYSDLMGAARSLFGGKEGIACILGTGSNSCLYDGERIVSQVPSLGFILGDEGSGAALGKRLVSDVFKRQLPEDIRESFLKKYPLTSKEILDHVYRQSAPNRFLASFVPFLSENLWHPDIYRLVLEELTCFFRRNVAMYPGAHSVKINFTGSIAFHFGKILKEAADSLGYRVDSVTETPMKGLVEYHGKMNRHENI